MAQPADVLVVDDTEPVRLAVMTMIRRMGLHARGAENGLVALDAIKAERPDLVLCDLRMPVMDGLELLTELRAGWPQLPVVVMSGAALVSDAVAALKLGAWDYLTKPIEDAAVLEHSVRRALERTRLMEENCRQRARLLAVNEELQVALNALAEDEDAGRQLQFRLLPGNHLHFGPFEFSRELVPSAYLSGDFVDAFAIDEGRWGFYLADVAGHGVSSALVTVVLRSWVQSQLGAFTQGASKLVLQPGALLTALNASLLSEPLEKHVTFFYGVIDHGADTLTWANAGQFPSPVLFDGGVATPLEMPGLPLGLLPGAKYEQQTVALGDEAMVTAWSDGVLEALPQHSLDEKLAWLTELFSHADVTLEKARASLHLEAHRPLPDDVTLMLIKREPAHVQH